MKGLLLILACGFFLESNAQKTIIVPSETSHEIWSEASASFKFSKNWKGSYTQSIRLSDETQGYKLGFSEYGLQYRLLDIISLKLKGRFVFYPNSPAEFRYYGDAGYEFQKKGFPLRIDYRLRVEDIPQYAGNPEETYFRNRFGFSYNLSKLADPYIQYESFYTLRSKNIQDKFSDHRFYAGIEWRLGKNASLNTGYFLNQEIQEYTTITSKGNYKVHKPNRLHTLVLELEYDF